MKNIYNLSLCDRKKNVIRKTLFHRFPLDKYHFYVPQTIKHENFVKELRSLKPSPERSLKNTERKMTRHSIEDYNSFESTSQNKLKPFNL